MVISARLQRGAAGDEGSDELAAAKVENLGPDGALISAATRLGVGEQIQVRFALDSHPLPFELDGTVRWVKEREGCVGVGVQFQGLVDYDRSALTDFCQRQLVCQRRRRDSA
jgi:hypothetical protein